MTRIGSGQSQNPPSSPAGQGAPAAAAAGMTMTNVSTGRAPSAQGGSQSVEAGRVADTFDGTRREAGRNDGRPVPPDGKLSEAGDRFTSRVEDILNRDALSLSRGETPWRAGEPLSHMQQSELKNAAKDYLMEVPVGSLAPQVKAGVHELLERAGIKPENLDSMSLRDVERHVGSAASDFAEGLVDKLKDNAPAAYYGMLGAGALAAGTIAYTKGSDALRRLGVRPEMKLGLFRDHIELRAGAEWDAKLRNVEATVGVRASASGERFSISGEAYFTRHGLTDARLSGALDLGARTTLLGSAEYQALHTLRDPSPDLSLAGNESDRLRASLSLVHNPTRNSSVALSATYDNVSGPWVGVGFSARF